MLQRNRGRHFELGQDRIVKELFLSLTKATPVVKTKLLFICSRNQWRSPTAEALFQNNPHYETRSAGTEKAARIRVTAGHLGWADLIFVMERRHTVRLRQKFADELAGKDIRCLEIPDDYDYLSPELLELLRVALSEFLEPSR